MADETLEVLEDFSGGINTFVAPNRLAKNQLADGFNFIYSVGALRSSSGRTYSASLTTDVFGGTSAAFNAFDLLNTFLPVNGGLSVPAAAASEALFITGQAGNYPCVKYTQNGSTTFFDVCHVAGAGRVATTSGSPIVTGASTTWLTQLVAGDQFQLGQQSGVPASSGVARFKILSVDSDTQITLTTNFTSTVSNSIYNVLMSWPVFQFPADSSRLRMFNFSGKMHFVPSYRMAVSSYARTFDGAEIGFITAFPGVKFATPFKNYVFGANTPANKSRVAWSALKDSTTWPASNFVDVNPDDGQDIVGLIVDYSSIVILKRNGAYRLTGDSFDPANPTYTLTKIITPSNFYIDTSRSAAFFNGQWVFLGAFGLYALNGNAIVEIPNSQALTGAWTGLTTPIFSQTLAFTEATTNQVNSVQTEKGGWVYKGIYYFSAQYNATPVNVAGPLVAFGMDAAGALWRFSFSQAALFYTYAAASFFSVTAFLNGDLYGIIGTGGSLNKLDVGDNLFPAFPAEVPPIPAETVSATATTKVFEYAKQQRFGIAYIYYKKQSSGSMSFDYRVDEGSWVTNTIDMTVGTGTRVKSAPIKIGIVGKSIQFRVNNQISDINGFCVGGPIELYAISYYRKELRQ